MNNVLLIHPPVAKSGEPPAGIARLKAALIAHGVSCSLIDANLEGIHFLLRQPVQADDAWTKQASRKTDRHIQEIRSGSAFKTIGHYNRIVNDLNRLLAIQGKVCGFGLGLGDCTHQKLSPVKSGDLIHCAETPEANPFIDYYRTILIPGIGKRNPEVIGLSVNFLSQALCSFALIGLIRKEFPGAKIVLGGGLITSWMRNPGWSNPFEGLVDLCVAGPGEAALLSYLNIQKPSVDMLEPKRFSDSFYSPHLNPLPENGRGKDCEIRKQLIIDYTVCPDFDEFIDSPYFSSGFVLPYNTSSGCFWRQCRFCPERAEGNEYRPIPHQQVLDDLESLTQKTNPSLIHFLDNALSPAFLKRLVERSPGVPWYGYIRLTEEFKDLDFCLKIKESGCVMLKLGLESGDQQVLDRMGKGIRLETASVILRNLKRAGIPTYVYLLFGTPHESENSAKRTMNFVLEHHESIGFINPAIFNMPLASEDATVLSARPFSEGNLSLYVDFDHPFGWTRSNVRHFLDRVFRRQPAIATILARTPKHFTSNHAPFFS